MRVGFNATKPAERDKTSSHNSRRSRQQQWPNLDDVEKLDDDKRGWRNLESNRDQPEVCGQRESSYHTEQHDDQPQQQLHTAQPLWNNCFI